MANEREVVFYDQGAATQRMLAEVLAGLRRPQKQIAPKYFYDEKGSQLFDAITELSEYYPTRIEMQLFDQHLPQVRHRFGDQSLCVVEYGSGSNKKIRRVLDTLAPSVYVPVDISRQYLLDNTHQLHADFPHIAMYPVCADISREFELPAEVDSLHKLGFYPGSSIGNFFADRGGCVFASGEANPGAGRSSAYWRGRKKACVSFGSGLQRRRRGNSAVQSQCSATFKRSAQYGF